MLNLANRLREKTLSITIFGIAMCFLSLPAAVLAERVSDVSSTKHNLSVTGPGPVKATSESQVCVFCHTPHAAENIPAAPLWNRQLSGAAYTEYTSSSINADDIAATPGGASKLCLSCHDGTLAIGMVNVANGQADVTIDMQGTDAGTMPGGTHGDQSGFTRKLGTDLRNDHPISFTYNSALAIADGELRDPALVDHIATRQRGERPSVPLENGQVQCTSCHDPHIRDSDITLNIKFLRLNRFQESPPTGGAFSEANDIVCTACHDKLGQAWAQSAHADPLVANEIYTPAAAALREFPSNQPVWKASCLNCHDTHTVQGARRLLREGTDSPSSPKSGGDPAQEETCYQCHSDDGNVLVGQGGAGFEVPDIKTDFNLAVTMPITTSDQAASLEVHDIVDADFMESRANLGRDNLNNRHVECTDCHNPHRVMKNRLFNGTGDTTAGTHDHGSPHSNIASGVLRGSWGVEPVYGSASFDSLPISYLEKKGDGGIGASTDVNSSHLTREYQVCLKCHSDYGYLDNNLYPTGNRPNLGNIGGTSQGTNDLDQFTNQAREFQAPITHRGQVTTSDSGAALGFQTNNHRSWHPVVGPTGRTPAIRDADANNWLPPFNGAVGTQTMYCSDCHGSGTGNETVVPNGGENGSPWGPHGSNNNFLLKGQWSNNTNDLCLKCHDNGDYVCNDCGSPSGFGGGGDNNMHGLHVKLIDTQFRCVYCHIAIPHGWKNKAFLVNLNDVGPEAGLTAGTEISDGNIPYTQGPYYMRSYLKVENFATSGNWSEGDCGGRDYMRSMCQDP